MSAKHRLRLRPHSTVSTLYLRECRRDISRSIIVRQHKNRTTERSGTHPYSLVL